MRGFNEDGFEEEAEGRGGSEMGSQYRMDFPGDGEADEDGLEGNQNGDDFSWGDTRKTSGEEKKGYDDEGEFDSTKTTMKRWREFERGMFPFLFCLSRCYIEVVY